MYKNNICFINDCDREALWLDRIIGESNIAILEDLSIVPQEHLQLCEEIQDASSRFENTLLKSYSEKNKILNNSKGIK
jgi:hypothetical protein